MPLGLAASCARITPQDALSKSTKNKERRASAQRNSRSFLASNLLKFISLSPPGRVPFLDRSLPTELLRCCARSVRHK
jgi:hypothetical protein